MACTGMKAAALAMIVAFTTAHVSPNPSLFDAESYGMVALRVGHGCEGAPTTKVVLFIPDAMIAVKPRAMPEWDISIEMTTYDTPTVLHGSSISEGVGTITWEGELSDDFFQTFDISFKLRAMENLDLSEAEMPGKDGLRPVFLPISQYCSSNNGSHEWIEVATPGGPEPESPAPIIYVNEKATVKAHGRR